jgi:hypothetical protein
MSSQLNPKVQSNAVQPAPYTSRFVEVDGLSLHYLDYGTAGRPPMLCVHGGAASGHWFDFMAGDFSAESSDPWQGALPAAVLAFVYAWTGDKNHAIAEYARLLRTPVRTQDREEVLNIEIMRRCPEYAPLRGDPRFEALLNDPKNSAPLF